MTAVTVSAPAKVNLRLAVGPPRPDGYHDLVNVFHAVSLFDEVTVTAAGRTTIRIDGPGADAVPTDGRNLAAMAAERLARRLGVPGGAAIRIRKRIPVAGGMAGGSADAAAALLACAELWGAGLSRAELMPIAAELGSDVPFSLLGGTAVGAGRGELLTPAQVNGGYHWVFALAHGGLSTPAVYAECDRLREEAGHRPGPPAHDDKLMAALREGDAAAVGTRLANDLQDAALSLRPELAGVLAAGRERAALGALVSGSGPTCAFLAESPEHADDIAAGLRASAACRGTVTARGPVPGAAVVPGPG
ncbi:4-(cytidine 5'-diphospho)-2-C-methyl-D-erythritol kinase [Allonocardiopsis opalescens]|uniref:4-diphosphocytidyl-2-C-methyl-D-erythritol kinase n=1 Tax=Allonocardiopsis opalescens TaxID=1144618 RepID=A0A2T0QD07_9ACTN|nr:4-diphosphocytidyl-2-C-methyl-D-erythritol kinase [Allonocardiopsis opalescens]